MDERVTVGSFENTVFKGTDFNAGPTILLLMRYMCHVTNSMMILKKGSRYSKDDNPKN